MIKSEVKNDKKVSREYPYLGVFPDGEIVLFTSPCTGTLIYTIMTPAIRFGHYSSDWDENKFTRFTGEITLSNEG